MSTSPELYSGLVQAMERCHIAGTWYNAGDVFEVVDRELWEDDPFRPIEVVGNDGPNRNHGPAPRVVPRPFPYVKEARLRTKVRPGAY